jgi:hypothetical protein
VDNNTDPNNQTNPSLFYILNSTSYYYELLDVPTLIDTQTSSPLTD